MIILSMLLFIVISGPITEWESLPNRTVEITLPYNKRAYHPIIEIGLCRYMKYSASDEIILKAGKQCYRISTHSFEINK